MTENLRVVPVFRVKNIRDERDHDVRILGLREVMNHGWIVTLADSSGARRISLMTADATPPINPSASIEVDDMKAAYATALNEGLEIVHP